MIAKLTDNNIVIKTESLLVIKADTNDGDYIHNIVLIESAKQKKEIQELLERVVPILDAKGDHNWETGDLGDSAEKYVSEGKMTQADADYFCDLVPYAEYGIHSIEDIILFDVINKKEY